MYTNRWDSSDTLRPMFSVTPWVRRLLIANAVVFLLQVTVFTGSWFVELFGFHPSAAFERPWTAVTYMFLHSGFLHLGFNMLWLFFFGSSVESRMGSPSFIKYYFFCGVGGAVLSLLLATTFPSGLTIGASGAIFGVALAFAFYWPDAPIMVFPLPFPIKAKWLVAGFAVLDIFPTLIMANDGIAHLAHLGGFAFGWIYLKVLPRMMDHAITSSREKRAVRVLVHPSADEAEESATSRPSSSLQDLPPVKDTTTLDDVDRVLDKISETGMKSLTPDELKVLDKMSRHLRNN